MSGEGKPWKLRGRIVDFEPATLSADEALRKWLRTADPRMLTADEIIVLPAPDDYDGEDTRL